MQHKLAVYAIGVFVPQTVSLRFVAQTNSLCYKEEHKLTVYAIKEMVLYP